MADSLVPRDLQKVYSGEEIRSLEARYLTPAIHHYYQEPLLIIGGEGASLVDSAGKRYIDLFAGICTAITGYSHPKFVATLKWQVERLVYASTLYATVPQAVLAEKLARIGPEGLTQAFVVNSGSEANEAALFMARKYTGSPYIVACHHGYHGRTALLRETSTAGWRTAAEAHPPGVRFTPNGYCYRCAFGKTYPSCGIECANYLREVIRTETNGQLAAFIVEPIQGVGGIIQPPPEYFTITYDIVKEYGGLYIADEVQTGFGRTGGKWWGIEQSGIEPDIITMAKGFAGGIPIGGFLTRPEFATGYCMHDSFSTFGGNPLSCAAAVAVIEIIQESGYLQRASDTGGYLKDRLTECQSRHNLVGDVRGQGMMLGVELVRDRASKEPAGEEMLHVMESCKSRGLLIGRGGIDGNVIRIQPPLELTRDQAAEACDILEEAIGQAQSGLP